MAERRLVRKCSAQLPKLRTRVRFSSPALLKPSRADPPDVTDRLAPGETRQIGRLDPEGCEDRADLLLMLAAVIERLRHLHQRARLRVGKERTAFRYVRVPFGIPSPDGCDCGRTRPKQSESLG